MKVGTRLRRTAVVPMCAGCERQCLVESCKSRTSSTVRGNHRGASESKPGIGTRYMGPGYVQGDLSVRLGSSTRRLFKKWLILGGAGDGTRTRDNLLGSQIHLFTPR